MARSLKKGPFVDRKLFKKVNALKSEQERKAVRTFSRASTIIPEMVGFVISVHNGKTFVPVYITEDLVGHKLGEFVPTRLFKGHSGDK